MSLRLGHSAICMFLPPLDLVCLTAQLSKACSEISAQLPMWATPPPTPSCLLTFNKPPGLRAPSFSSFNNWFSLKSSNTVFSGTTDIEQEASTAYTPQPHRLHSFLTRHRDKGQASRKRAGASCRAANLPGHFILRRLDSTGRRQTWPPAELFTQPAATPTRPFESSSDYVWVNPSKEPLGITKGFWVILDPQNLSVFCLHTGKLTATSHPFPD